MKPTYLEKAFSILSVVILLPILTSCEKKYGASPESDTLILSCTRKSVESFGGSFDVEVRTRMSWSVSADREWISTNTVQGAGNSIINVSVEGATSRDKELATLEIKASNGESALLIVERGGNISHDIVYDVCGNTYNVVSIGTQYWMCENMRCNKYGDKSGKQGAVEYIDGSNTSIWDKSSYNIGIHSNQISQFGYYYTWETATGMEVSDEFGSTKPASTQGICPDGWHIPSVEEFKQLEEYVQSISKRNDAANRLRTKLGWVENKEESTYDKLKNKYNVYGFAALPTGMSSGGKILNVGISAGFWTSEQSASDKASYIGISSLNYSLQYKNAPISMGLSVRCVR